MMSSHLSCDLSRSIVCIGLGFGIHASVIEYLLTLTRYCPTEQVCLLCVVLQFFGFHIGVLFLCITNLALPLGACSRFPETANVCGSERTSFFGCV